MCAGRSPRRRGGDALHRRGVGADVRRRAADGPGDAGDPGGHRGLGPDHRTGRRRAAGGKRDRGRGPGPLRSPVRRLPRADGAGGSGRPPRRRAGIAGRRRGAEDGGQLLAGRHHPVGLRQPRHAVQPARLARARRGLRGGRLRAVPQRPRRRGRPHRRRHPAAGRDAQPRRLRPRRPPRRRARERG